MTLSVLTERVRTSPAPERRPAIDRVLGHPLAYALTALVILAAFGWTFVDNPGRPAPADDPAFYAWRTEALISEKPVALLEIDGPRDMLVGGYRVSTPLIAGFMRHIAAIAPLAPTALLAVGLRVVIPLLLGGLAFRYRRDPLVFHAVAFASASLLPTPSFGGYLDNVVTLMFLAAALFLIAPARASWPARIGLTTLLFLAGLTHPTTLAMFCVVLGAMALVRLAARRFDLRSVIRDDGPALASAIVAAVATYAVWKLGVWGEPASLSEAAVPPPADATFFQKRLGQWIRALRPTFNAPLMILGAAGLLAAGKRAAEDDLTRIALVWLLPLAGVFGFLAGVAYPYYRFLNTTLGWVLLIGLGCYFATRFFLRVAARGGANRLALVGVAVVALIIVTNFTTGFVQVGWNSLEEAWITPDRLTEMDALRAHLAGSDRPVVFVADDEAPEPVRIYGFTKLVANVSRYGVALGQQDRAFVYLGSLESYLAGDATERSGDAFYGELSRDTLLELQAFEELSGEATEDPIAVVASSFNTTGSNVALAAGEEELPSEAVADALVVRGTEVEGGDPSPSAIETDTQEQGLGGPLHVVVVIGGLALLMVPGFLAVRWMLPDAGFAEWLGLVPALAMGALAFVSFWALALLGDPLTAGLAWALLAGTTLVLATLVFIRRNGRSQTASAPPERP